MDTKKRVSKRLRSALDQTGLPWNLEQGAKHIKVRLAGRFVGILPYNGGSQADQRADQNVVAQVRRAARELAA